jgi:type IV secretion system protein TrbL
MFPIGNPFDDMWDFVTSPFEGLAGWAGDKIFEGITNWIAKGCVQLLEFVWSVMDRTASPHLNAEWFSGTVNSPYQVAARIGGLVLLGVFFVSIAHGVATGDVGGVMRRAFADLPMTVFVMLSLVTLAQAAVGLTDAMSDSVWEGMRTNAVSVFDGIGRMATTVPGGTFLAPLVLLVLMIALLFLWFVLMLRDALIYLVVVLAIAFGLPGMVWPTLRGMARHTIELLAALILAKPVIALALSVGVGALGGVGATGTPGDGIIDNGLAEFGTLVVGIITFGLAAFMPYLVYRLIPVVAAATVAAGVASGPLRAASTGMQFQYYAQSTMHRLSSGRSSADGALDGGGGEAGGSVGWPGSGSGGGAMSGARMAGPSGSAGAGAGAAGAGAGAAAGPVGIAAVVVASAARKAASSGTRAADAQVPQRDPEDRT